VAGYALTFGVVLGLRGPLQAALQRAADQAGLGPGGVVLVEAVVVAAAIGATIGVTFVFRRFVNRRPLAGMAMPPPWRRWRDVAAGFAMGAAMILVVIGVEYGLGWLRIDGVKEGFG
jgi:hypothetical protein